LPRKDRDSLKEFHKRLAEFRLEKRKRLTRFFYYTCPNCGAFFKIIKAPGSRIVYCPKCNFGLELPVLQVAQDHDYYVALFDFITTNGEHAGIFTNYPKKVITSLDGIEIERRPRERRVLVSDEIREKILSLGRFTSDEVAEMLGVDDRTARKIIRSLRDEGLVQVAEIVGSRKVWEVKQSL